MRQFLALAANPNGYLQLLGQFLKLFPILVIQRDSVLRPLRERGTLWIAGK